MKKLCGFLCVFMSLLLISSSALAAGSVKNTIFKRDYGDSWVFRSNYVVLHCTPLGEGKVSATVEGEGALGDGAFGNGVFALNDYAEDLGAKPISWILHGYDVDFSPFANMALSMCDEPK